MFRSTSKGETRKVHRASLYRKQSIRGLFMNCCKANKGAIPEVTSSEAKAREVRFDTKLLKAIILLSCNFGCKKVVIQSGSNPFNMLLKVERKNNRRGDDIAALVQIIVR